MKIKLGLVLVMILAITYLWKCGEKHGKNHGGKRHFLSSSTTTCNCGKGRRCDCEMKPPCELIVWYVLPTIRYELTKELLRLGLSQKEVSESLGITQAAVSQYVKEKRTLRRRSESLQNL